MTPIDDRPCAGCIREGRSLFDPVYGRSRIHGAAPFIGQASYRASLLGRVSAYSPTMPWAFRRACLLASALAWCASVAEAADAPSAEALFRAGREASKRGEHAVACERFRESYRLDAAPGTLLNIAVCEEAQHQLAEAWETYQHVLESLAPGDDRRAMVKERIAVLDAQVPRLTLNTDASGPPPTVLRDGVQLSSGAFGVPLPIDPGEHRIAVRAPDKKARQYVVTLSEGERLELQVEPGEDLLPEPAISRKPSPPQHVAPRAAPRSGGRALRTAGYVAGGLGLAGFVGVGVLSALAFREKAQADENCPNRRCNDAGFQAVSRGDRLLRLADVGLVVGILGVTSAGVLIWQATRSEVRLQPAVGGAGVSYTSALP